MGVFTSQKCSWYRSTWSVCRRRSEASMARMMFWRELPASHGDGPVGAKHLVASTNRSRRPLSQRPRISSVRPRSASGAPSGYASAVSRKVMPASAAASRMATEAGSSHWKPNVIVPRHSRDTRSPVRPNRTCSMAGDRTGVPDPGTAVCHTSATPGGGAGGRGRSNGRRKQRSSVGRARRAGRGGDRGGLGPDGRVGDGQRPVDGGGVRRPVDGRMAGVDDVLVDRRARGSSGRRDVRLGRRHARRAGSRTGRSRCPRAPAATGRRPPGRGRSPATASSTKQARPASPAPPGARARRRPNLRRPHRRRRNLPATPPPATHRRRPCRRDAAARPAGAARQRPARRPGVRADPAADHGPRWTAARTPACRRCRSASPQ